MNNVTAFRTYKKELHCMNCNQMATEEIPWGQIADVKEKPCPKCGVSANKFTEYLESNRLKAHPHGEISELAEAVIKLANSIADLKPLEGK
jgi:hypothetical protein